MNLRKLKLIGLGLGTVLRNTDPFSAAGTNIFDAVEKKREPAGSQYPEASTQWSPSQATPGKQNPYPPAGQGAIEQGANRGGGSPLDSYMENAHTYAAEDDSAKTKEEQKRASIFDNGYEHFSKSLESSNFLQDADAELAEKALKGDTKALMQLVNTAARRSAAGASYLSSQVAKQGLTEFDGGLKQSMPSMLAEQEFARISFDDPALKDPKVQPIVSSTIDMFRKQYPKASAAQIKQATQKYLAEVLVTPASKGEEKRGPSMKDLFSGVN